MYPSREDHSHEQLRTVAAENSRYLYDDSQWAESLFPFYAVP